ncbi:MAG: BglII/BstYI family type II restriction endonuclease [Verrucomicrobiota bacterium]|jgi:hypothetical protein
MLEKLKAKHFEILTLHHAEAILKHDMPEALDRLENVLLTMTIPVEELVKGGGGEGKATQRLRMALNTAGWKKHRFEIKRIVDGVEKESISHEIDHVGTFEKGIFALEIEWNNKDPFFDRDLENFKRLHADGVISVGAIITRGKSLHDAMRPLMEQFAEDHEIESVEMLSCYYSPTFRQRELYERCAKAKGSFAKGWAHCFVSDKFGESTTHWRKLEERVKRGVGNPCPLLLIGIPKSVVISNEDYGNDNKPA